MADGMTGEDAPNLSNQQRQWRGRIFIATYFAYAGYYLTRKVFTICKTDIAADLGCHVADTAHLWTAYLVAYMAGQFVTSYLGRQWGSRIILLSGLGLSIGFNAMMGFANSFETLMALMILNGLVQATGWPGCIGGIARWIRDEERGRIMGAWATNYMVGNILVKSVGGFLLGGITIGSVVLHGWGWRWSFWGCSLLTMAIWALVYCWQRDRPEDVGLRPIVDETPEDVTVAAPATEKVSFKQYLSLATHPVIIAMGMGYFCVKFLRYALDSWLPTFFSMQGVSGATASYYSQIFDLAGLAGNLVAGVLLDRVFRGRWAVLCFLMALGTVLGYLIVLQFQGSPFAVACCFGIVGFMIYAPDAILSGTAALRVAGERNAIAVAGLVNGLGSIGPIAQEQVISRLIRGDHAAGMARTDQLTVVISIAFALSMLVLMVMVWSRESREPKSVAHR